MASIELLDFVSAPTGQSLISELAAVDNPRNQLRQAWRAWLLRSPSMDTRSKYERDLGQFLSYCGMQPTETERLPSIRPHQVATWRDQLAARGLTNSSIRRKLTVL